MEFIVKIDVRTTLKEVKAVERRVNNLAIPFENYGRWFKKETDRQFDKETNPEGTPWAKLRPSTLARKRYLGYSLKILTASGHMRNTLDHKATKGGVEVWIEGAAEFHQFGTENLPERKIIGMSESREDKLTGTIDNWIQGAVK